jgi:hypothetical protein
MLLCLSPLSLITLVFQCLLQPKWAGEEEELEGEEEEAYSVSEKSNNCNVTTEKHLKTCKRLRQVTNGQKLEEAFLIGDTHS